VIPKKKRKVNTGLHRYRGGGARVCNHRHFGFEGRSGSGVGCAGDSTKLREKGKRVPWGPGGMGGVRGKRGSWGGAGGGSQRGPSRSMILQRSVKTEVK